MRDVYDSLTSAESISTDFEQTWASKSAVPSSTATAASGIIATLPTRALSTPSTPRGPQPLGDRGEGASCDHRDLPIKDVMEPFPGAPAPESIPACAGLTTPGTP